MSKVTWEPGGRAYSPGLPSPTPGVRRIDRNGYLLTVGMSTNGAEVFDAAGKLERLFAPLSGFLSDLSVAGDDTDKVDPPAPGLAVEARPGRAGRGRGRRAVLPAGAAFFHRRAGRSRPGTALPYPRRSSPARPAHRRR